MEEFNHRSSISATCTVGEGRAHLPYQAGSKNETDGARAEDTLDGANRIAERHRSPVTAGGFFLLDPDPITKSGYRTAEDEPKTPTCEPPEAGRELAASGPILSYRKEKITIVTL